jgi:hypothetical protein
VSGKHRGPLTKDKINRFSRITLDKTISDLLYEMAEREQRSVGNLISVLVTEAIQARIKREGMKNGK